MSKANSNVIRLNCNEAKGIKYWAQKQPEYTTPKYLVFKIIGKKFDSDIYYLQNVRTSSHVIVASDADLDNDTLYPFLYVNKNYKSSGSQGGNSGASL